MLAAASGIRIQRHHLTVCGCPRDMSGLAGVSRVAMAEGSGTQRSRETCNEPQQDSHVRQECRPGSQHCHCHTIPCRWNRWLPQPRRHEQGLDQHDDRAPAHGSTAAPRSRPLSRAAWDRAGRGAARNRHRDCLCASDGCLCWPAAAEDVERLQPLTLQQAVEKAVEIIKGQQDRFGIARPRPAILLVFCHRANAISPWPGPASSP
mgnify:CR=1 FL=1